MPQPLGSLGALPRHRPAERFEFLGQCSQVLDHRQKRCARAAKEHHGRARARGGIGDSRQPGSDRIELLVGLELHQSLDVEPEILERLRGLLVFQ